MDIKHYGVTEKRVSTDNFDMHVEAIECLGYTVVESGFSADDLEKFRAGLDLILERQTEQAGGRRFLEEIGEADQVRAPLCFDDSFLAIAANPNVLEIVRRLLGNYFILTQQNGIVNRPSDNVHHQSAFHRDLPYQHFVSTRPIGVNALLSLDAFDEEAGSTTILPGSHRNAAFPSDAYVRANERSTTAPAGAYIVMDSMLYHRAGYNRSNRLRRAVNNVYALGFVKQQIVLPALLKGKWSDDPDLARLLGYDSDPPSDLETFIESRIARARQRRAP